MSHTSLTLLERLRDSDESESWDRLAELYTPLLRAWMRRYDVQESDADDVVQQVLMTVAAEVRSFDHNGRDGAFRSWLRKILANRLREHWRARKYRPVATGNSDFRRQLDELADDRSGVSELWDREHDEFVMKRLMEIVRPQFEPRTWQAFRRQVVDGERADAVAAELGMKTGAVYMAKSRVLNALRRESTGLVDG